MKINIKKKIGNLDIYIDSNQDFIGILGRSGAGKSMLLKCICGVEKPDSGEIIIDGKILYSSDKNINLTPQQRKIGYLFQNYALFDNLTVEENIKVVNSHCNFENITKICKINELLKRKPNQLSGGQKQRVAIARILASDAQLILLDEPFSALDFHTKNQLEEELFDLLKTQNKRCVFVSHNHDEIYRNSQEIGIIENGSIIDFGNDVFENPTNKISADLLGFNNVFYENNEKLFFKSSDINLQKNGKYQGIVIKKTKNIDVNVFLVLVNDQKIRISCKIDAEMGDKIHFDVNKVIKFE